MRSAVGHQQAGGKRLDTRPNARRLAAGARNGACIHGDELKRFVVTRGPDTVGQGLSYLGAAALTDVFLEAGYDLVVFEFVFERRLHAERFLGALRSDVC